MNINFGALVHNPIFGLVLAPVVKSVVDFAKSRIGSLDRSSPGVKQAVVAGVSILAALSGQALGQVDAGNISAVVQTFDPQTAVIAITAALGAVAMKHGEQVASVPVTPAATSAAAENGPSRP